VLAAVALAGLEGFTSVAQAKKNILRAVESVSHKLGNTRAVCRKCYVHPAVFEGYMDGTLLASLNGDAGARLQSALAGLRPDEANVLTYLQQRAAGQRQRGHARATPKAA
jgi:DNA topoisomerase-1